jgi:hypothetical protein
MGLFGGKGNEVRTLEKKEKANENVAIFSAKLTIEAFNEARKHYGEPERYKHYLNKMLENLKVLKSEEDKIISLANRAEADILQLLRRADTPQLERASSLQLQLIRYSKTIDSELNKLMSHVEQWLKNEEARKTVGVQSLQLFLNEAPEMEKFLGTLFGNLKQLFNMESNAEAVSKDFKFPKR